MLHPCLWSTAMDLLMPSRRCLARRHPHHWAVVTVVVLLACSQVSAMVTRAPVVPSPSPPRDHVHVHKHLHRMHSNGHTPTNTAAHHANSDQALKLKLRHASNIIVQFISQLLYDTPSNLQQYRNVRITVLRLGTGDEQYWPSDLLPKTFNQKYSANKTNGTAWCRDKPLENGALSVAAKLVSAILAAFD